MEARVFLRPLASSSATLAGAAARRHQSTTARTKKALKVAPHPSFGVPPSGSSHIIYNPPSSAASVYHTPFKFLPKSDPRRQANLTQLLRTSSDLSATSSPTMSTSTSAAAAAINSLLPPPATNREEARSTPQYTVSREQVDEMRQLRADDPATWTVPALAEKFNCTKYFVLMCTKAPADHKARETERKAEIRNRWGPIRTHARQERRKRYGMLLRGEL